MTEILFKRNKIASDSSIRFLYTANPKETICQYKTFYRSWEIYSEYTDIRKIQSG